MTGQILDPNHGWVRRRPDGSKARCGGPATCKTCQQEQREENKHFQLVSLPGGASPVALAAFKDALYVATKDGVYERVFDQRFGECGEWVFREVRFVVDMRED